MVLVILKKNKNIITVFKDARIYYIWYFDTAN